MVAKVFFGSSCDGRKVFWGSLVMVAKVFGVFVRCRLFCYWVLLGAYYKFSAPQLIIARWRLTQTPHWAAAGHLWGNLPRVLQPVVLV